MRAILILTLSLVTGCAAARATVQLVQAETAVSRAEEKQAKELAIYEYTMARRFLDKAREENGYADYRQSVLLAQEAAEWADRAIIAIEEEGRAIDLEDDPLEGDPALEDLPDSPEPEPPMLPAPEPTPPAAPVVPVEPPVPVPAALPESAEPEPAEPEPADAEEAPPPRVRIIPRPASEGDATDDDAEESE